MSNPYSKYDNYITPNTVTYDVSEYKALGVWNSSGTPSYMTKRDNLINLNTIQRVLNSLPEGVNQVQKNPSYFMNPKFRNLVIQTDNPNFIGADVFVSFVYEGAGYKNTLGYYWYDISKGNKNPITTDEEGNTIEIDYNYLIDPSVSANERKRRRGLLNKTIIFPNASGIAGAFNSLPSGYASTNYGGGTLNYGDTVQIFYDINNKSKKWPNNVSIGLFLIPNGWDGRLIRNTTAEHIFTNNTLNPKPTNKNFTDKLNLLPCDTTGFVQAITLFDELNSNEDTSYLYIAFEDIMRNTGDRDTNDCIACFRYTPSYCVNTDGKLILSNDLTLNNSYKETLDLSKTEIMIDKTGIYYILPRNSIQFFTSSSVSPFKKVKQYKIQSDIRMNDKNMYFKTKNIFKKLKYDYNGEVKFDDDKLMVSIILTVEKYEMQIFLYIVKSKNNRFIEDWDEEDKSFLLGAFQRDFVNHIGSNKIRDPFVTFNYFELNDDDDTDDEDNKDDECIYYKSYVCKWNINHFTPYAMGDPHITTIYGESFELPNIPETYLFYQDSHLNVNISLDYHPDNVNNIHKDLVFMKTLDIKLNDNSYSLDLFNIDNILNSSDNILTVINPSEYDNEMNRRIASLTKLYDCEIKHKYIKLSTSHIGDIIMECINVPKTDVISNFGIIYSNIMLSGGKGLFMYPC